MVNSSFSVTSDKPSEHGKSLSNAAKVEAQVKKLSAQLERYQQIAQTNPKPIRTTITKTFKSNTPCWQPSPPLKKQVSGVGLLRSGQFWFDLAKPFGNLVD